MNWYKKANEESLQNNEVVKFLSDMAKMRGGMNVPDDFIYASPEEFVLKHGKPFVSQPLSQEELDFLKRLAHETSKYQAKQCFYNAQSLAHCSNEIKYVEGYLYAGAFPIQHAWNSLNGKVIDFTVTSSNKGKPVLGVIPEGWQYFGVPLPSRDVMRRWFETSQSGPLIDNWQQKFPMLKKEFNPQEDNEDELV